MKYCAENISTKKFNKIIQKIINDWHTQRFGIIEKDYDAGLSSSKRNTNLLVNGGLMGDDMIENIKSFVKHNYITDSESRIKWQLYGATVFLLYSHGVFHCSLREAI